MTPSRDSMDGGHAIVGKSEAVTLHWPVVHCDCHCPPEHTTAANGRALDAALAASYVDQEVAVTGGVALRGPIAASPADGAGVDVERLARAMLNRDDGTGPYLIAAPICTRTRRRTTASP
jgi:hypothetical protein